MHLISDLEPKPTELDLLIDQIDAEHQDEPYQSADRLIQIERIGCVIAIEQRREREGCDCEREQQNHRDRSAPQPPLAAIQMMQMLADLLRLKMRSGLTVRGRRALSMNVRHGSSLVYYSTKDARAGKPGIHVSVVGVPLW